MFWLTWLCGYVGKLFRCLIKNIRFCRLKHNLRKLRSPCKNIRFIAQNTAGKQKSRQKYLVLMPTSTSKYAVVSLLFKNPALKMSRCLVKKYPVVSRLRMSTGQTVGRMFWLTCLFCHEHGGKIYVYLVRNTTFCCHKHHETSYSYPVVSRPQMSKRPLEQIDR